MEVLRNEKVRDICDVWFEDTGDILIETSYFTDYTNTDDILKAMGEPVWEYTEYEVDLLARLITQEAGSSWIPDWVQRAVGSVVLNRVKSKKFPGSIHSVIFQRGQYSPAANGRIYCKASDRARKNAEYVLRNGSTLPPGVLYQGPKIGRVYTVYRDKWYAEYFCYG